MKEIGAVFFAPRKSCIPTELSAGAGNHHKLVLVGKHQITISGIWQNTCEKMQPKPQSNLDDGAGTALLSRPYLYRSAPLTFKGMWPRHI